MRILLAALLALSPVPAFTADASPDPAQWLAPFKQQLKQALKEGLAQRPAHAIDVCRIQAPAIAASVAPDGVRMGRSSHRLRNPANAPADWLQPVIEEYLQESEPVPRQMDLADGRKAWVEPIMTDGVCLACHGEKLSPAVSDALARYYPEDQATGFKVGDLRGVFWVTWKPAQ